MLRSLPQQCRRWRCFLAHEAFFQYFFNSIPENWVLDRRLPQRFCQSPASMSATCRASPRALAIAAAELCYYVLAQGHTETPNLGRQLCRCLAAPGPGPQRYGDLISKGSVWRSAFLGPDKMVKKMALTKGSIYPHTTDMRACTCIQTDMVRSECRL